MATLIADPRLREQPMTSDGDGAPRTLAWRISVPALGAASARLAQRIEAPFRHFRIFADDETIVFHRGA